MERKTGELKAKEARREDTLKEENGIKLTDFPVCASLAVFQPNDTPDCF